MIGRHFAFPLPGFPPQVGVVPGETAGSPAKAASTAFPGPVAAFPHRLPAFGTGFSAFPMACPAFGAGVSAFWFGLTAFRGGCAAFSVAFPGKRTRKAESGGSKAGLEAGKAGSGGAVAISDGGKAGKVRRNGAAGTEAGGWQGTFAVSQPHQAPPPCRSGMTE